MEVAGSESFGTWWARNVPSTGRPSTTFGPVQPLGDFKTIIGQRGRVRSPDARAFRWISRICSTAVSSVVAMAWCISCGSWPSTK